MASESEVEAAQTAYQDAKYAGKYPDSLMWFALEAAERVRGEDEHVVLVNNTSNDMAICRMNRNGEAFGPATIIKHGRELVIRKAVK